MEDETTRDIHVDDLGGLEGMAIDGRYLLEEQIGEGGMAVVFRALDRRVGGKVVVKMPHLHMLDQPEIQGRFDLEAKNQARLAQEHIVRVLDRGRYGQVPYFVMQFLEGGSLKDKLQREGKQSIAQVMQWLRPLARTLDEVHEQGFLHRDVKPANILFNRNQHPFLSDFGISRALGDETFTRLGGGEQSESVIPPCSPAYTAPEIRLRDFSPSADQYSLATTVFVALSGGQLPFEGQAEGAALLKRKSEVQPRELRTIIEIDPRVSDVVRRAMAQRSSDRFPSCAAFAEALGRAGLVDPPQSGTRPLVLSLCAAGLFAIGAYWLIGVEAVSPVVSNPTLPAVAGYQVGNKASEVEAVQVLCASHAADPSECRSIALVDKPLSSVDLAGFAMDRFEVTRAEFAEHLERNPELVQTVAEKKGHSAMRPLPFTVGGLTWRSLPENSPLSEEQIEKLPVTHLGYRDAAQFCERRGARLPTEAEWEYAARGKGRSLFPWGDVWDPLNAVADHPYVRPVGSVGKRGLAWRGHEDLAGNAWEWTSSREGAQRVIRGGSFADKNPARFRGASRMLVDDDYTGHDLGFRCAQDID